MATPVSTASTLFKAASASKKIKGLVFDIQHFSLHDGPGIRTLVFMKGCPLRCLWCDNPESQNPHPELVYSENMCIKCGSCVETCPHGAISMSKYGVPETDRALCVNSGKCIEACCSGARRFAGRYMTVEEVFKDIEKDVIFFRRSGGGVTISGGEPTMQAEFSQALLRKGKEHGLNTAMETCGYAKWQDLGHILPFVDVLYYDIKHMDSEKHRQYTGVGNELILDNLTRVSCKVVSLIVRIPIIPGYNDSVENVKATADFVSSRLPSVKKIELIAYHVLGKIKYKKSGRKYRLAKVQPPSKEHMQELKAAVEAGGVEGQIIGI